MGAETHAGTVLHVTRLTHKVADCWICDFLAIG
jgi:hypothetical protein